MQTIKYPPSFYTYLDITAALAKAVRNKEKENYDKLITVLEVLEDHYPETVKIVEELYGDKNGR
jgi:hypothetical protein